MSFSASGKTSAYRSLMTEYSFNVFHFTAKHSQKAVNT
jgi:hypothetical protein